MEGGAWFAEEAGALVGRSTGRVGMFGCKNASSRVPTAVFEAAFDGRGAGEWEECARSPDKPFFMDDNADGVASGACSDEEASGGDENDLAASTVLYHCMTVATGTMDNTSFGGSGSTVPFATLGSVAGIALELAKPSWVESISFSRWDVLGRTG